MKNQKPSELDTILESMDLPGQVNTLSEFVSIAMAAKEKILSINPLQDFYLTECSTCCNDRTSYRFFAGMPEINPGSGHADTSNAGFIVKVYHQPGGLAKDLSEIILMGIKGARQQKIDASQYGTCYRVWPTLKQW